MELGHAHANGRHVASLNGNVLKGLHDKLTLAKDALNERADVFRDLLQVVLVPSDPDSTASRTRNRILHGQDLEFATQARSTQIVLWTCAVLIELLAVLPDKSPPYPQAGGLTPE